MDEMNFFTLFCNIQKPISLQRADPVILNLQVYLPREKMNFCTLKNVSIGYTDKKRIPLQRSPEWKNVFQTFVSSQGRYLYKRQAILLIHSSSKETQLF